MHARITESSCPDCGQKINCTSGEGPPDEGDFSICWYCSSITIFKKDLSMRIAKRDEIEKLRVAQPAAWAELMKYKKYIIKRLGGIQ